MLHVVMREMRIWPQDAAKCCKNASKFFPDVIPDIRAVGVSIAEKPQI